MSKTNVYPIRAIFERNSPLFNARDYTIDWFLDMDVDLRYKKMDPLTIIL